MTKTPRIHVPRAEFLHAWETSSNADEVSQKLGIKKSSVLARASGLRKFLAPSGITLKKLGRTPGEGGGRRISMEETVAMLNAIRGEQAAQGMTTADSLAGGAVDDADTFAPVD